MKDFLLVIVIVALFNLAVNFYYGITMFYAHIAMNDGYELKPRQATAIIKSMLPSYFNGLQWTSFVLNILILLFLLVNVKKVMSICGYYIVLIYLILMIINLVNLSLYHFYHSLDITTSFIILCTFGTLLSFIILISSVSLLLYV
jgi:hypothetical protein